MVQVLGDRMQPSCGRGARHRPVAACAACGGRCDAAACPVRGRPRRCAQARVLAKAADVVPGRAGKRAGRALIETGRARSPRRAAGDSAADPVAALENPPRSTRAAPTVIGYESSSDMRSMGRKGRRPPETRVSRHADKRRGPACAGSTGRHAGIPCAGCARNRARTPLAGGGQAGRGAGKRGAVHTRAATGTEPVEADPPRRDPGPDLETPRGGWGRWAGS